MANNQVTEYDRAHPLFEREEVPFEVVVHEQQNQTCKKQHFTMRILNGNRIGNSNERAIRFELSDEWNYYAGSNSSSKQTVTDMVQLYVLEVGEHDFHLLRKDQALLVDFPNFASSLIALLDNCKLGSDVDNYSTVLSMEGVQDSSVCTSTPQHEHMGPLGSIGGSSNGVSGSELKSPVSRIQTATPLSSSSLSCSTPYTCRLELFSSVYNNNNNNNYSSRAVKSSRDEAIARFSIVESNRFRELTHISLNLTPGNNESIRAYLSARLLQMLKGNATLHLQLQEEAKRAHEAEENLQCTRNELRALSQNIETEKRELQLQADERAHQSEQERTEQMKRILEEKDYAISTLSNNMEDKVRKLQFKLDKCLDENKKLTQNKYGLELKVDQMQSVIDSQNNRLLSLEKSLEESKLKLSEVDDLKRRCEQKLHDEQLKLAGLEKTKESKEDLLIKAEDLRQIAEQALAQVNQTLADQKIDLNIKKEQLAKSIHEIHKGNDMINKMLDDRKEMKRKIKLKNKVIQKQEEVLREKDDAKRDMEEQLKKVESDFSSLQTTFEFKKRELEDAQHKLKESGKILESNQQVITWLNKEINDSQIGRPSSYSFYNGTSSVVSSNITTPSSCNVSSTPMHLRSNGTNSLFKSSYAAGLMASSSQIETQPPNAKASIKPSLLSYLQPVSSSKGSPGEQERHNN